MEILGFRHIKSFFLCFDQKGDEEYSSLPKVIELLPNLKLLGLTFRSDLMTDLLIEGLFSSHFLEIHHRLVKLTVRFRFASHSLSRLP